MRKRYACLFAAAVGALLVPAPAARPFVPLNEAPYAQRLQIPSWDGTILDGWVVFPGPPAGRQFPLVLRSTPYQGSYDSSLNDADRDENSLSRLWPVPVDLLLANDYAVATVNVRGTGNSGGCFDLFGPNEQKDQYHLVEWLADQPWSNGRVGMMGKSYDGTTPLEAAILNPPSLKTIVVGGVVPDLYTSLISPQGAVTDDQAPLAGPFYLAPNFAPPRSAGEDAVSRATVEHAAVVPERLCPEVDEWFASGLTGWTGDDRNQAFYDSRRLIDRFPGVTTSVLLAHGFQDHLAWAEDLMWEALRKAPKLQLEGQWFHEMPPPSLQLPDWNQRLLRWLAFWLKGEGETPGNEMRYQAFDPTVAPDTAFPWRTSPSWPPPPSSREVLYLANGSLGADPAGGAATFLAAPTSEQASLSVSPRENRTTYPPPCFVSDVESSPSALVFETGPLDRPLLIAGNPMAYLRISSSRPGGRFALRLFSLAPDFECVGGVPTGGYRFLSEGAIDLRFHQGNFVARDFPVSAPTNVRIDLQNLAEVLPAGYRLAATLSFGAEKGNLGDAHFPAITVHGDGERLASHLVLPIVDGTLGGGPPTVRYPPRPFAP